MTDPYQELISEYIQSRPNSRRLEPKRVAKKLGIRKRDFEKFLAAWRSLLGHTPEPEPSEAHPPVEESTAPSLIRPGQISGIIKKIGVRGAVFIPHPSDRDAGVDRATLEVLIAPEDMRDAQVGDEVMLKLTTRRASGGKRCGRVVEVLQRATNSFVGTYDEFDGQGYVKIDGRNFTDPIWVGDPGSKGAAPGDKVVIEMLRFPTHAQTGEAVLTQVLGEKGKPGVDLLSIIHEYNLPDELPSEVQHEASKQAERFDESDLSGRLDLTGETIITIDPADARDFDDAISLKRNEVGNWELGVHIADVAHFVKPGSQLDREAKRRGTSVYLPTRVLPMLPEVISNGLASLQQGRVRYTNSAFIEFTSNGVPVHTEFAKTAIKVVQRFAYEEVMPIVVQASSLQLTQPPSKTGKLEACTTEVRQLLLDMHELAMTLRRRRFAKGSLDLNLPEVKLDFDTEGRVSGAHAVEHDESHQMIEEFMLAANIAVATKLSDLGVGFLRRVHNEPDSRKLQAFAKFVATLGFEVGESQTPPAREHRKSKFKTQKSKPSPFDSPVILSKAALQKLLKEVHGTPAEHAINYALLRSLKQAEYSGIPIGHYALSVSEYCHFTSPIRRYPDLTIHRLFDEFASGKKPHGLSDVELAILGTHCSDTERRAAQAERELTKLKLLAFMAERVGEEFDAVITGVERFGLFCQGVQMPVDGFVHITALTETDYFDFDPDSVSLIGRASGARFRLGDRVRVQVAFVNVDRRELDFRLISSPKPGKKVDPGPQQGRPNPPRKFQPANRQARRAKPKHRH